MTYPRSPEDWRGIYTLTATRYPRLYVGQWHIPGGPRHWWVLATDDTHDTAPTGPSFKTKAEALAWIEGPEALDWLPPLPPKEA